MAVMDFACAKGPSIVADGFDMFIVRTFATNGSMSFWQWKNFGWIDIFWFEPSGLVVLAEDLCNLGFCCCGECGLFLVL